MTCAPKLLRFNVGEDFPADSRDSRPSPACHCWAAEGSTVEKNEMSGPECGLTKHVWEDCGEYLQMDREQQMRRLKRESGMPRYMCVESPQLC